MQYVKLSRYISYILRHNPEAASVVLDEHGWADVDELIDGVSKTHPITRDVLEEIVRTDAKQRYTFSSDGTRIRANHGHSIKVDPEPEETIRRNSFIMGRRKKTSGASLKKGSCRWNGYMSIFRRISKRR